MSSTLQATALLPSCAPTNAAWSRCEARDWAVLAVAVLHWAAVAVAMLTLATTGIILWLG